MGHGKPAAGTVKVETFMSERLRTAIDEAVSVWTGCEPGTKPARARSRYMRAAALAYMREVAPGIASAITDEDLI
jgi:hypothetical protein